MGAWRNGSARSSYCRNAVRLRLRVVSSTKSQVSIQTVKNADWFSASPLVLVRIKLFFWALLLRLGQAILRKGEEVKKKAIVLFCCVVNFFLEISL